MSKLNIELCPETGICSIIKSDGQKVDLMPDELGEVRNAAGRTDAIQQAISEVDDGFAATLTAEELQQLASTFRKK
jgi:hypothetical protein